VVKDLFSQLEPNVKPARSTSGRNAHWIEYDIDMNGQPIKVPNDEEMIFGHLTRDFPSEFEAMIWLRGNRLQGRYLGHGYLDQVKGALKW
jgi:hypothetical protein